MNSMCYNNIIEVMHHYRKKKGMFFFVSVCYDLIRPDFALELA